MSRRRLAKSLNKRHGGPELLVAGRVLAHPWEYYTRRRAARRLMTTRPALTIDPAAGFNKFEASAVPEAAAVIDLCHTVYEQRRDRIVTPSETRTKTRKADHFVELLTDEDLVQYPQLVDFCLSPSVLDAVSRYLGTLPVLHRVGLLLSLPSPTHEDSRLFHLDPEDTRQIKVFINLVEVRDAHGPLNFLPGNVSSTVTQAIRREERAVRKPSLRYRRWMDHEVLAYCQESDVIRVAGPAGTGVMVDTSRCLHFGSRMAPETRRLVFMAQFLRYHFAFATDANRVEAAKAGRDPLRSRVLVERPSPMPFGASRT